MVGAFDGHRFEQSLDDVERVVLGARDLEERLVALVNQAQQNGPLPVDSLRSLCLDAQAHRQMVELLNARIVGSLTPADGLPRKRILVVDDSLGNLEILTMVLEDSGFEVVAAHNGLEALVVAHSAQPVLILMDVSMPILNGIEAARLLKASPATRAIRVIAYTAEQEFSDPRVGPFFADIVRKPATPQDILASVLRLLGQVG